MSVDAAHHPSSHDPNFSTPIRPRYDERPSTFLDEAVMSLSGIRRVFGTLRPNSRNPQPEIRSELHTF